MGKVIFHIDMNSFFASCEIAENESLRGKKVVVVHNSIDKRGIVLAASYEAKAEGVYTTQPLYDVLRKVPDAVLCEPRHHLYEEYSERFFSYFYKLTPLVEPGSIDEAYLDVTNLCDNNEYVELAKKIQKDILELYHLPCSIGIGPNKFLAKMASDMKKPLGITVLRKRDVEKMLWPLPMSDMFGAGKKTCEALNNIGIKTIGDLVNYPNQKLIFDVLGPSQATYLLNSAHGEGSTEINPNKYDEQSSISNAHTFDYDVYNLEKIKTMIKILANNVNRRMVDHEYLAKTFTLTLKFNNFKSISKAYSINDATDDSLKMFNIYLSLLEDLMEDGVAVRLISVAASKFSKRKEGYRQLTIFDSLDQAQKEVEVRKTLNKINDLINADLKMGISSKK